MGFLNTAGSETESCDSRALWLRNGTDRPDSSELINHSEDLGSFSCVFIDRAAVSGDRRHDGRTGLTSAEGPQSDSNRAAAVRTDDVFPPALQVYPTRSRVGPGHGCSASQQVAMRLASAADPSQTRLPLRPVPYSRLCRKSERTRFLKPVFSSQYLCSF